jgi:deoxycytidylate deaminase
LSKQQQDITAVIYDKRGRVLSIGKNSYVKTHPLQLKYSNLAGDDYSAKGYAFIHAELQAIIRCADLTKAKRISVFRVRRDGSYGISKPCKACQIAIEAAGIKFVEHT